MQQIETIGELDKFIDQANINDFTMQVTSKGWLVSFLNGKNRVYIDGTSLNNAINNFVAFIITKN